MVCCGCQAPAKQDSLLTMLYTYPNDFVMHLLRQRGFARQSGSLMQCLEVLVHHCTSCRECVKGLCMLLLIVMSCSHIYMCRVEDKPKDIFGIREGKGADANGQPEESGMDSSATEMNMDMA